MTTADRLPPQLVKNLPAWVPSLAGLVAATLAALGWALFLRATNSDSPISFASLREISYNPYMFGIAAQELALPLLLLLFFSRTALFQRALLPNTSAIDLLRLALILCGIQALFFLYRYGIYTIVNDVVYFGMFVVLVAGLLGGWRVGLAVGVVTLLGISAFTYLFWYDGTPIPLAEFFEYGVLKNMEAVSVVWVGVAVGLAAPLLGGRRFLVWVVGLLAVVMETAVFVLNFLSDNDLWFFNQSVLPTAAISTIAMVGFALMVRNALDDKARRQAEAAQLELAQANLALTETRLALAQAELRALHAQINPHFFFNTLNTIRYFIRTEPEKARELLVRLSEIFQRALSAGEFVALADEISYVEAYLALEKARLEERLRVVWTVLAKEYMATAVPTLVLQPIVENGVIHGLGPKPAGGTLHIVISRLGQDLLFQVEDDGVGFDVNAVLAAENLGGERDGMQRPSIGLRNVDERLKMLYGTAYGLMIESTPGAGTRVVFKVPLPAAHPPV